MNKEELKDRTKKFAQRCIKLCLALPNSPLGSHIRSQLIRSATSTAANYRAACLAKSKSDFVAKIGIVVEEVDESCFWMELIIEEMVLAKKLVAELLEEGKELTSIFIRTRKTACGLANNK